MIIIVSLLILCGLFFSIRGEIFKEQDSKSQAESLSNTKKNTEDLKEKSELIITNINENLERLIVINDSVSNLNSALSKVENDLANQLEIFNKTLNQTKLFEQKVNEQLKLEKKRFELEKPDVEVVGSLEKANGVEGNQYRILFEHRNLGKRVATDFNSNAIIGISKDKQNLTAHFKMVGSLEKTDMTPTQTGGVAIYIRSSQIIDFTDLENDLRLIILLKYSYKDEYLDKVFEKKNYFFWYGFEKGGLTLISVNNKELTDKLDNYIREYNLKL